MSDKSIIDYVIATTQSSKSTTKLKSLLQSAGLPDSDSGSRFVNELFQRVPRNVVRKEKVQEMSRRKEDLDKVSMVRKNNEFKLLLEDDEGVGAGAGGDGGKEKKRKKDKEKEKEKEKESGKGKKVRAREEDDDAWKDDGYGNQVVKRKRYTEEVDMDQEEQRMEQDIKDRDELAQRMLEKAQEKTKKIIEDKNTKASEEAQQRRRLAEDKIAASKALNDIRERSRQQYLGKREDVKILMLEQEIRDEEELFRNEKMSKTERKNLEYKKEVLRLAKERMKISDKVDGYMMPEDYITEKGKLDKKKQDAALYGRYEENDESFVTEQSKWEDLQIQNALRKGKKEDQGGLDEFEFDYVFDEDQHVKFIQDTAAEAEMMELDDKPKISEAERKAMDMKAVRESLPIFEFREEILAAVEQFQVLIIVGETGSGKTTQIPQYLSEAGYTKDGKKVGCTQPRRVAAMSVAARVAEEMNTKVGYEVGYSIRFEDCTSDKTIIKFMTDGMLLREFLTEPDLASYSCLMIDEAHERTLHTDILFGLVKDIARYRKDIKLLISSATMDAEKFRSKISEMKICPIYSTLPSEKQAEIFEPTPEGVRKVVLATNIAETSITIDGIVYVIDPGFVKQKSFNPKTGMESLVVVPASRAAANQRKGRAGRNRPGKCFRLYTSWAFQNELDENTIPEIQRVNLGNVVLLLKSLGINDLLGFDFMDAPPVDTLKKALEQLYALGALNSRGELTKLGRQMAEYPIDPMLSKMLIAAEGYKCTEEVVSIIAMLSTGNAIFFKPKSEAVQAEQARRNFFRPGGDHITLLAVWDAV
ncbi:hypothetical protein HDU76_013529 [Blyttiomyces sp. JEL0837]|nr:hypothetical protein HDU76_013529 [Blyttiomyces sp. JEL0837]